MPGADEHGHEQYGHEQHAPSEACVHQEIWSATWTKCSMHALAAYIASRTTHTLCNCNIMRCLILLTQKSSCAPALGQRCAAEGHEHLTRLESVLAGPGGNDVLERPPALQYAAAQLSALTSTGPTTSTLKVIQYAAL